MDHVSVRKPFPFGEVTSKRGTVAREMGLSRSFGQMVAHLHYQLFATFRLAEGTRLCWHRVAKLLAIGYSEIMVQHNLFLGSYEASCILPNTSSDVSGGEKSNLLLK